MTNTRKIDPFQIPFNTLRVANTTTDAPVPTAEESDIRHAPDNHRWAKQPVPRFHNDCPDGEGGKTNVVLHGDCLDMLQRYVRDKSVNLITTSPPYGKGGVETDNYIKWFCKRAEEFERVLTKDGSFVLNICSHVEDGVVDGYVDELIATLKKTWLLKGIYYWRKLNPVPTTSTERLRNAIEPCYHFALQDKPAFYPSALGPVLPDNVIEAAVESRNLHRLYGDPRDDGTVKTSVPSFIRGRRCCIPFPEKLAAFFIDLFTKKGDVVLDPYSGLGITAKVGQDKARIVVAIETEAASVRLIQNRLRDKRNPYPQRTSNKGEAA
jgi:DNA modification methylase